MVTTIGTETDLRELIRDLIALDCDAIAAYEAAIERLDDEGYKESSGHFATIMRGTRRTSPRS